MTRRGVFDHLVNVNLIPQGPADGKIALTSELVHAHQDALWRYLRVLGCPPTDAEDLLQETFLALLHAQPTARGDGATRNWLRSTARNLYLAHCRARGRQPCELDEAALEIAWQRYEGDDDGQTYRAALRACLQTLPAQHRELLERQVRDRATPAQLAAQSGLQSEGARTRVRRIKQALRACISRRLHDDS